MYDKNISEYENELYIDHLLDHSIIVLHKQVSNVWLKCLHLFLGSFHIGNTPRFRIISIK